MVGAAARALAQLDALADPALRDLLRPIVEAAFRTAAIQSMRDKELTALEQWARAQLRATGEVAP